MRLDCGTQYVLWAGVHVRAQAHQHTVCHSCSHTIIYVASRLRLGCCSRGIAGNIMCCSCLTESIQRMTLNK